MNFPGYVTAAQASLQEENQKETERQLRILQERSNTMHSLDILKKSMPKLYKQAKKSAIPIETQSKKWLPNKQVMGGWIIGSRYFEYSDSAPCIEPRVTVAITERGTIVSGWLQKRGDLQILIIHRSQYRRRSISQLRNSNRVINSILDHDGTATYLLGSPFDIESRIKGYLAKS